MLTVLLSLAGLWVRVWGLPHGLPDVFYMDEGFHVYYGLNFGGGDLNPHEFERPSLYYYLCFVMDVIFILGARFFGFLSSLQEAWTLFKKDPTIFYVLGRLVSVLTGTLTIPLVARVGKSLFGKQAGFIAAFFLAFAYLHVQYSQIAYLDVTLAFFALLTFWQSFRALETGRARDFALAGLVAGLTASTKYNGLPVVLLGPLSACLFARHHRRPFLAGLWSAEHGLFLFSALIGFSIGTPFWILDFSGFKQGFLQTFDFYKPGGGGKLGYEGSWNWFYYLTQPLRYGLGWPLEITALAGFFALLAQRSAKPILFVAFPLIYFLFVGSVEIRMARYILPIVPFLCLSAGYAVSRLARALSSQFGKSAKIFAPVLTLFLVSVGLTQVLRLHQLQRVSDTRQLAHQWLKENVLPDAKILQTLYSFVNENQFPNVERLDGTAFDTRKGNVSTLKSLDDYRREGFQYLVLDDWHVKTVLNGFRHNPRRRQVSERYGPFLESLAQSAELVAEFSPYGKNREPVFNPENVEFPSTGLWKMKAPGPPIRIYRLAP